MLTAADSVAYLKRSSTVCVTQEDDKPKIYISLNNAEQERIRFSSNLTRALMQTVAASEVGIPAA